MTKLTRRTTLGLLGGLSLAGMTPPAFAQGVEGRKLIFVFLRGAVDGLSAVIPDDQALVPRRPNIMPDFEARHDLGNGFRLHPSLEGLKRLYDQKEAAFIHAAAPPYETRSHFDAQDLFETMGRTNARDGWLNRVVQLVGGQGVAIGHSLPLAMQGAGETFNWSPPVFDAAPDAVLDRLEVLYEGDPQFSEALVTARSGMMMASGMMNNSARRFGRNYVTPMQLTGQLMSQEGGPGIGMVSLGGWDSHANQIRDLENRFKGFDQSISVLKHTMGDHWRNTCVVLCSEFGRTVAENGTRGTDHGTGGVVMLLGGAVSGGQMYGDWPGVKSNDLFEDRDLAPANQITGILKGILRDQIGIDRADLNQKVFPDVHRPMD
ncbi:MAG: DUF1501 domain-containing protein, partial [Pseudomonadota bacterium]